jgi:TetR/AcrR family transcriptional regulator, transcriptional repressor for nem operon
MRTLTKRKEVLKDRLLAYSSAVAKKRGLSALTIDAMMRGIDRTGSIFYSLFRSKLTLIEELVERELESSAKRFTYDVHPRRKRQGNDTDRYDEWEARILKAYINGEHARDVAAGCALPILTVDVARLGSWGRTSYERTLKKIVASTQSNLGCSEPVASAIVVQCIGAVMVARAIASDDGREELLAASAEFIRAALNGKAARRPSRE